MARIFPVCLQTGEVAFDRSLLGKSLTGVDDFDRRWLRNPHYSPAQTNLVYFDQGVWDSIPKDGSARPDEITRGATGGGDAIDAYDSLGRHLMLHSPPPKVLPLLYRDGAAVAVCVTRGGKSDLPVNTVALANIFCGGELPMYTMTAPREVVRIFNRRKHEAVVKAALNVPEQQLLLLSMRLVRGMAPGEFSPELNNAFSTITMSDMIRAEQGNIARPLHSAPSAASQRRVQGMLAAAGAGEDVDLEDVNYIEDD